MHVTEVVPRVELVWFEFNAEVLLNLFFNNLPYVSHPSQARLRFSYPLPRVQMLTGSATLPPPISPSPSGSRSSSTTPSSDASLELSFDYDFDTDGNFIRISKGSTNASGEVNTPPQLSSIYRGSSESPSPAGLPASVNLKRSSLSRSDSAPTVAAVDSSSIPAPTTAARSFQRVTSASALTPGTRGTLVPSRKLLSSAHRVTVATKPPNDEKENILSSSRHVLLPSAGRAARSLKRYASGVSTSEIPDIEAIRNGLRRFDLEDGGSGDEQGKNGIPHVGGLHAIPLTSSSSLSSSTGNRQRRSASLSQASSLYLLNVVYRCISADHAEHRPGRTRSAVQTGFIPTAVQECFKASDKFGNYEQHPAQKDYPRGKSGAGKEGSAPNRVRASRCEIPPFLASLSSLKHRPELDRLEVERADPKISIWSLSCR